MQDSASPAVNVLIVDDDPVFRRILINTFSKIAGASVVAAVGSIAEARELLRKREIRLITLDVVMNGESGLDFLPWVSKNYPKTIVTLLTAGQEKRASQSIDAVLLGAVALIIKPSGPGAPAKLLESLSRVVTDTNTADKSGDHSAKGPTHSQAERRELIAIGSSTGGPPMLQLFLNNLVPTCRVPIIITQHMAPAHVPSLISMLDKTNGRHVCAAEQGQVLAPSTVYVASGGKHLLVKRDGSKLIVLQGDGPEENYCRPAVDPMFRSVAEICGRTAVGVVMTGMGSDGALGATALKSRGAPVVVQDKQSSVVWGMPGAVVAQRAASFVVSGNELAPMVSRLISPYQ